MMMANALIDIPAIRRIDKLENVHSKRHSTGKVIMPSGGLTVLSRYLRVSQGSCHDICKYGTSFSPETESKILRSPIHKIVAQKRGAGRNLERVSQSNFGERRKKSEIIVKVSPDLKIQEPDDPVVIKTAQTQGGHHLENVEEDLTDTKNSKVRVKLSDDAELQKPEYPAISFRPSCEHPVDIETMAAEGEAEEEENAETKSSRGEKNRQVCVKPSPDSESQEPVGPDCVEGEITSWTDKKSVLPEQVLLSLKETEYAVAHAKDSKLKPQSKPSSLIRQACSSGKQNSEGPKRKEANIMSMTSSGVSGGRNKGEMTISKGIRTSVIADKKNVVAPSVSLSPKEPNNSVSSMNARKKKLRGAYHSKKQENAKQIKPEKLHGKNAKRSDNLKGVSHLMDLDNIKKPNSEQDKPANIPEMTSYLIESNPENKPTESDQNNVVSIRPSSSSKDKSMNHNQNRIPIGRPPCAYEKNFIYRPKGIHASGLPPSLYSFPGKKNSRPTPNASKITQPSLTSLSSSVSSKSSHNDTLTEHDTVVAEKQKSSSKMMYKARPKRVLMITSNNKHLPGKMLSFQRGKVIEVPVEDCTPRRLAFKKRELMDNRNNDNRNCKVEDCTPRRLKFRQGVNVDNINGDNRNSRVEEFTPKRLKFRRRVIVDNRNGDNQNSRIEEFTPRRLEFRRKLIVDNINGDNQNGRVEEFTPRRLESGCRTLDNRNADDQNGRGEDSTPRKLIFRQKVLDEKKIGYIQNTKGGTSKNNSGGKEANVGRDNDTKIQSEKISLRHRDVKEKKGSGILYNNIIEQTASRLARTKASKVKALVSAFETVISNLDTGISETNDGN